jgi:predicted AlkP superfamily pyrophosphatase or phosphodiesterase
MLRMKALGLAVFVCLLALSTPVRAQDLTPVIKVDNPPNTPAQQAKHYVILVSLDGFRYDYPVKYGAPHLLALGAAGATAPDGMLPVYPSLTFPNHIAIITGLYPEHHGIVGNSFRDPARPDGQNDYVYRNPKIADDGTWYKGTPLWALAEQQGMRSASIFWPSSTAEIQGKRPSYYLAFNDRLNDDTRIDQIVAWLKLPPELRPHFITLYYSNVDHAGHEFGPDSDQVRDAVHHTDDLVGELQTKVAALNLPIDIVVVADHGMINFQPPTITLSDYSSLKNIQAVGPLLYAKTEADAQAAYEEFRSHPSDLFSVYRRKDVPANLHYNDNPREGDPVIVLHGPYRVVAHAATTGGRDNDNGTIAGHGFDPRLIPQMKAIFFAAGPDIQTGAKLAPFENVNIYPFLAKILGLNPPKVDGKIEVLAPALMGKSAGPKR